MKSIYFAVLDDHSASKAMKELQNIGIVAATTFYADYYKKDAILHFFGIEKVRKEIIFCIIDKKIQNDLHRHIGDKFKFENDNTRHSFSIDLDRAVGVLEQNFTEVSSGEMNNCDYKAIFVVVDKNSADKVIDLASEKGATGATVIHGRGAGIRNKSNLFDLVIEPQKEIVFFLVKQDITDEVIDYLNQKLEIDLPNKGIIFQIDVNQVYGINK